jgi:L-lactate dehydrogenase complex protein LldF
LLSAYTSFLSGARRPGEIDGPDEFYVVLLDNGRTRLLPDREKRQTLYCIRCGACLNACPVYRKIGGYSFPGVYSGPIGAILTPQFMGVSHEPALPFASSLCGACAEVCPVKIDIPKVLLDLRADVKKAETRDKQNRLERLAFRAFAWLTTHPRLYEMTGRIAAWMAPASEGKWISSVPPLMNLPPVRAWLSQRDLPPPPAKSFREQWRQRR